jgi:hypothetical protein
MNKIQIIHICGASGSGKTFLGNKLQKKFKKNIIVKDLDELRDEFVKHFYGNKRWTYTNVDAYQKFIDNYIIKQNKTILFVGLNDNPKGKNKNLYYNLHSKYNYYIDIDDNTVHKQKCLRFLNDEIPNNKYIINNLINNNKLFIKQVVKGTKNECNLQKTIKMNNKWKKDYTNQGYTFLSRDKIFSCVSRICK